MASKYRNEDKSKPNLTQTQSSTSEDVKLNKAKQLRRDQDNVKNVSVGIYDVDSAFKNFLAKGGAKVSDLAADASQTLKNPFDEGVTLEQITSAGATPFSQASGDVIYGDAIRQKKEFDRNEAREAVEAEMRQRGLDQSYIDSVTASMTAYGYTQAEIDAILELQGYEGLARGGRVGYSRGGGIMDTPEADFISMDEVVENVNEDQLMAGMGNAMKLFETPYGFDRGAFEDMLIQYDDSGAKGKGIKLYEFATDFLGMVKKDTPSDRSMAMGGGMMRMGYAGGSEDIVEPSKSMQVDTTTYPLGQDPDNFPIKKEGSKIDLDIEMIKKLIEKRKKEKKKLAMGGIAGVL